MKGFVNFFCVLLCCYALTGCSVNPVTGKNELSLLSPSQEIAIGEQNYAPSQQAQGGAYYIDPQLQSYVQQVGQKLAAASHQPNLPYEFVVLNNSVPNAWALPGGKIAINRGLLTHLESEAELAAVLGHEVVHAAARHSAAQMTRGTLIGAGAQILGMTLADSDYSPLANTAIQLGAAAWMSKYGRDAELESDLYGMEYMAKAGYDPQGAVRLQETFVKLSEGQEQNFLSGLFASHPPSQERVEANRITAKSLPQGSDNRIEYQQKIAQLKKDAPAYAAQDEAIKALQNKKAALALQHLDRAIQIQPREGYFWELRGHAWKMQKDFDKAEQAFSTAINKNPNLFSHYLARGLLRYEQKQKALAREDLKRSNELLPTQKASYLLGELALSEKDTNQALSYYQSALNGGGEIGKQAAANISRIELPSTPHKYLLSKAYMSEDGYLLVAIKNQAPIAVSSVRVRLVKIANGYPISDPFEINAPGVWQAGEQRLIKTGIGPFKSAQEAGNYLSEVTRAVAR